MEGGWRFVSTTVCQPAKPVAISLVHIILHSTHQPPMLMVATVILFNWKIVLLQKFSVQISCLMITKRALSTSCVCLSYLAIVWRMEDLLQLNTQRKATKCRAFVVKPGLGCCSTLLVVMMLLIWYKSNYHLLGSYHHHHHHHHRKSTTIYNSLNARIDDAEHDETTIVPLSSVTKEHSAHYLSYNTSHLHWAQIHTLQVIPYLAISIVLLSTEPTVEELLLCNSVHILDMISGNWCWGD